MARASVHVPGLRAEAQLIGARVEIDDCPLAFETTCAAALDELEWMLRITFSDAYYRYSVGTLRPDERHPTLRYEDVGAWSADWKPETATCTFTAPWDGIAGTTVLAMWLFYLSELERQERGEYLLHASAVERDGRAIVLFGSSECGKTVTALELCREHGFRLFANNRVKVGLRDGVPRLLRGDPVFNLRFSSLHRYSEPLARELFDASAEPQTKRRVLPEALGIDAAEGTPEVAVFVLLGLDEAARTASVDRMPAAITSPDAFRAVAAVYDEISSRVRGTAFVPIALRPGSARFFVPSLDRSDLVETRMAFLEALFAASAVLKLRAPLDQAVSEILARF